MVLRYLRMSSLIMNVNYWAKNGYELSGITTDGTFYIATLKANGV